MSISIRQQIALNLVDVCVCHNLDDVYGVSINKSTEKKKTFWSVTFCVARVTDGVIRVYSPNFIMVKWQTANRNLPHRGQEVFKSEELAKDFLIKNFSQLV